MSTNPTSTIFEFKKGELIFREGDEINGLYFLQSGVIKLNRIAEVITELYLCTRKKSVYGCKNQGTQPGSGIGWR
ncbi:MAG: cyclic nucleotide-binding domain-containing protein [Bacteroidota bacterium]